MLKSGNIKTEVKVKQEGDLGSKVYDETDFSFPLPPNPEQWTNYQQNTSTRREIKIYEVGCAYNECRNVLFSKLPERKREAIYCSEHCVRKVYLNYTPGRFLVTRKALWQAERARQESERARQESERARQESERERDIAKRDLEDAGRKIQRLEATRQHLTSTISMANAGHFQPDTDTDTSDGPEY